MKITYLYEVREPSDQVGNPGDTREISDYLGEKLIASGYAIAAKPEEPAPKRKGRIEDAHTEP